MATIVGGLGEHLRIDVAERHDLDRRDLDQPQQVALPYQPVPISPTRGGLGWARAAIAAGTGSAARASAVPPCFRKSRRCIRALYGHSSPNASPRLNAQDNARMPNAECRNVEPSVAGPHATSATPVLSTFQHSGTPALPAFSCEHASDASMNRAFGVQPSAFSCVRPALRGQCAGRIPDTSRGTGAARARGRSRRRVRGRGC